MIDWNDRRLELVDLPYNDTIRNERAVELAIVFDWLTSRSGAGLEVGNVLAYYGHTGHRVVDLYESGAENIDVFDVTGTYDWIVAISTIEHVHWDDRADPAAAAAAVSHLRTLLAPGGELLVTVPLGWNPPLDVALPLDADRWGCWQRSGTSWTSAEPTAVAYGPAWANKVWVGLWTG